MLFFWGMNWILFQLQLCNEENERLNKMLDNLTKVFNSIRLWFLTDVIIRYKKLL